MLPIAADDVVDELVVVACDVVVRVVVGRVVVVVRGGVVVTSKPNTKVKMIQPKRIYLNLLTQIL